MKVESNREEENTVAGSNFIIESSTTIPNQLPLRKHSTKEESSDIKSTTKFDPEIQCLICKRQNSPKSRESQFELVQGKGCNSWVHKRCAREAASVNMDVTYFCMPRCMSG